MSALSSMSGLSRTTAMRVASLITAINVLVAVGFSVAGLVNPKWILPASYVPTEASFIFALYAAARTIPLAVIALVAIYQRSESAILLLGTLAGFIQLLDAGVGLLQHDLGKSIGPRHRQDRVLISQDRADNANQRCAYPIVGCSLGVDDFNARSACFTSDPS
jgi:hypothetical protein